MIKLRGLVIFLIVISVLLPVLFTSRRKPAGPSATSNPTPTAAYDLYNCGLYLDNKFQDALAAFAC